LPAHHSVGLNKMIMRYQIFKTGATA